MDAGSLIGSLPSGRVADAIVRSVRAARLGAADALAPQSSPASQRPLSRRVLVRREVGIGDILFALSAAQALGRSQPSLEIDFVTSPWHVEWVRWFPFVRRVLTEATEAGYELVLDHEAGLDKSFPGDRAIGMGLRGGVVPRELVDPPRMPTECRERAAELLGTGAGDEGRGARVIAFAPLAANGTATRSLPLEAVPDLVAALRETATVVLLHDQRVPLRLRRNVANLTGRLTAAEAMAVVSECDALVGIDSGLLHVAAVFGKPLVGLFNHIAAEHRLGLADGFVALQPALGCFPCGDLWGWNLTGDGVAPPCRPSFRPDQPGDPLDCLRPVTPALLAEALRDLVAAPAEGVDRRAKSVDRRAKSVDRRAAGVSLPVPPHPRAGARGYVRSVRSVADGRVVSEWTPPPPVPPWVRDNKTSVVILNHCTWQECTRDCLDALLASTAAPFEVVLLDNGSSRREYDAMASEIPALERKHRCKGVVNLLRSSRNLGFPGGVNRALAEADPRARYVCLLNSDCFVREPRWNERAARLFRDDWRLGALCLTRGEHRYFLDGDTGKDYYFPELDRALGDAEMVNGSCLMVDQQKVGVLQPTGAPAATDARARRIAEFGNSAILLDEGFAPASREDDDLCFRIRAQGWSVGQAPDFDIVHEHSTSLRKKRWTIRWHGETLDYHALLRRNRRKLLRKWSGMLHPRADVRGSLDHVARLYRPKVSVVMPTRHRLDIIDESVQSVLGQTLADVELIIVAATKREVEVLTRRYATASTRLALAATTVLATADGRGRGKGKGENRGVHEVCDSPLRSPTERVQVVRQEGQGIAGARNTGMRLARGVYLAHMDDDEVWAPEHLCTLVAFLERYPHLALVYGDVRRCKGYFRRSQVGQPALRKGTRKFVEQEDLGTPWCRQFDFGQFLHGNWIPASAVVMRRQAFEALGGFDESLRYADDWDYWLRVAQHYPVAHCCTLTTLGRATVTYRLHGANATQRDAEVWTEELAQVRGRYAREA